MLTRFRSEKLLKALLGHQIARTTVCRSCGYESRVTSPHEYRLGVALRNGNRLEDLLRKNTFAPATILGYRCDSCKQQAKAIQHSRLTTFPDILEIDFLRFEQIRRCAYKKNSKSVPFGEELDLSAFSESNTAVKYRLLSVVQHLGSFGTGHYRCIAKSPGGAWDELDDGTVRKVRVSTAIDPRGGWTPYSLFYARVDLSDPDGRGMNLAADGNEVKALSPRLRNASPVQISGTKSRRLTNGIQKLPHRNSTTGKIRGWRPNIWA